MPFPMMGLVAVLALYVYMGLSVAVVYISHGVGCLHVAYPYMGAMRRPGSWDRRERDILPRLFLFP